MKVKKLKSEKYIYTYIYIYIYILSVKGGIASGAST